MTKKQKMWRTNKRLPKLREVQRKKKTIRKESGEQRMWPGFELFLILILINVKHLSKRTHRFKIFEEKNADFKELIHGLSNLKQTGKG